MIDELVPLDETRSGQELLQRGRVEGLEMGRREAVQILYQAGHSVENIAKLTGRSIAEVQRYKDES